MSVQPDDQRARDVAVAPTVMATGPISDHGRAPPENCPEHPRGALLGRYIVLNRLGVGGMGVVYTAFDPELDRKVAIKLLQHRGTGSMGPARLLREAKAMARLSHPGVITVHDVGLVDNQVFIAMELVEGGTLREWTAAAPRTWREVIGVFAQAAEGLAAAHDAGLVHRDFKPDNVLIGDDGRVRVLDFGLAQAIDDDDHRRKSSRGLVDERGLSAISSSNLLRSAGISGRSDLSSTESSLSQSGAIIGTPAYMAPEQHLGADVDARTDLFSFCIALWEALYGQPPFDTETRLSMVYAVTKGTLIPPPDRGVPRWLHALLIRGLRPDPDERPATMQALLDALKRGRRRRRKILWASTVVVLIITTALLAWALLRAPVASPCQGARDRLAGIWDGDVQASLSAAFNSSTVPYAAATWDAVRTDLTGYADAWTVMYVDTCEAAARGEQSAELMDLRMACLNRHLLELGALTEVLGDAVTETAVVSRARRASSALPALDRCADVLALTSRTDLPDDIGQRRMIDDVQARIARLRAHLNAGQIREALEILPAVAALAESADYAPAQADVAYIRGQLLDRNGDLEEAEASLIEAVTLATASRQDMTAADAMVELIYTVGVRQARADDALLWARLAAATSERLQPGKERDNLTVRRLEREGLVLAQRGDLDTGRARQEEALALSAESSGPSSIASAAIRLNLSATLADLGDLNAAQVHLEAAARILGAELGADHPHVAIALNNLGALFESLGAPAEALIHHQRALEIKIRSLGADHPSTANSHNNIAATMISTGDFEGAAEHVDRALVIKREVYGEDSPLLAETLGLRGVLALRAGAPESARTIAAEALALAAGFDDGKPHPTMLSLHQLAAKAAAALGDLEAAQEHFRSALAIYDEVGGEPAHYADVIVAYADLLWATPPTRPRATLLITKTLARATAGELDLGLREDILRGWLDAHGDAAP